MLFRKMTWVQRGDIVTNWIDLHLGTWRVILWEIGIIAAWIVYNALPFAPHLDAYPFFLLNLTMSMFATLTSNIIKMAQDRHQSRLTEHTETTAKQQNIELAAIRVINEKQSEEIAVLTTIVQELRTLLLAQKV